MQVWPVNFPRPRRSLNTGSVSNTFRSQSQFGRLGQRHRFDGQETYIDISWEFLNSVFGEFLNFHKYSINLGSDWFLIGLPLNGSSVDVTARFVEAKFGFRYVEPTYWLVTARLEMLSRPTINEAALDVLLAGALPELPENYFMVEADVAMISRPEDGAADELTDDTRLLLYRD